MRSSSLWRFLFYFGVSYTLNLFQVFLIFFHFFASLIDVSILIVEHMPIFLFSFFFFLDYQHLIL